jgi:tRNA(Arg) A34 adenosine deaminase TadA
MCLSAIYWAGLEKIYYANTRKDAADIEFSDDFIYKEISLDLSERTIPMEQHMHGEALRVFSEWKDYPDKIKY